MSERKILGRSHFQAARLKQKWVDVPEIEEGGQVLVRELNSAEAVEVNGFNGADQNARVAAMVIINEDGSRVFDPDNPDDVQILAAMPASAINRICMTINELNGKTRRQLEESAKNSEASLNTASASA